MEVTSTGKYIGISPKKVRLVARKMENLSVASALTSLKFLVKGSSVPIAKIIKAAAADAAHNYKLDAAKLKVKKIEVGEGPMLKRGQPRSRGMSHPILKRTSHIKVVLED